MITKSCLSTLISWIKLSCANGLYDDTCSPFSFLFFFCVLPPLPSSYFISLLISFPIFPFLLPLFLFFPYIRGFYFST